jgi:hypothetical protein
MTPRALQIVQQLLITAVTIVLAMVVFAAFLRVIRPPDEEAVARATAARTTTTTTAATFPGAPVPIQTDGGTVGPSTTTVAPENAPPCREEAPATGSGTVLRVYYTCGPSTVPTASSFVYRVVPDTSGVLTATMEELVKGPDDAERELGFVSFFSPATAGALAAINLSSGTATIDLTGIADIPNLTTATGSQFFIANLNANVFQFDTIDAVEFRLDGSCDAFWALFQSECQVVTRSAWEQQLAAWRAQG